MAERFAGELERLREDLIDMASRVLQQVEGALAAWDAHDLAAADRVISTDEEIDDTLAELDHRIFSLHLHEAPAENDLRLLHVALIAAVAIERVGDLAVSIARLTGSSSPEAGDPAMRALIGRMSARAVDGFAQSIQAIARGDVELGERSSAEAAVVRGLLDELIAAAGDASGSNADNRHWIASAVLLGRHLERIANNGRELGGRVRFLVTGEAFRRAHRPSA